MRSPDDMINDVRKEMGVGKSSDNSKKDTIARTEAFEIFNTYFGPGMDLRLNDQNLDTIRSQERKRLNDGVALYLSHIAEGSVSLSPQMKQEIISSLQILGFTVEEVPEIKLNIDLLEGRNPDEAWDEYGKKFAK